MNLNSPLIDLAMIFLLVGSIWEYKKIIYGIKNKKFRLHYKRLSEEKTGRRAISFALLYLIPTTIIFFLPIFYFWSKYF